MMARIVPPPIAHGEQQLVVKLERICRERALRGLRWVRPEQQMFVNIEPISIFDPDLAQAIPADRAGQVVFSDLVGGWLVWLRNRWLAVFGLYRDVEVRGRSALEEILPVFLVLVEQAILRRLIPAPLGKTEKVVISLDETVEKTPALDDVGNHKPDFPILFDSVTGVPVTGTIVTLRNWNGLTNSCDLTSWPVLPPGATGSPP